MKRNPRSPRHLSLPRTRRGLMVLSAAVGLGALLVAAGWVGFSVWVEDRFPSGDPQRALLPAAQEVMTKPIVRAISQRIERHLRNRAEAHFMLTGRTVEQTIARFLDERTGLTERGMDAYRLARVGSPACVAALLKVFQTAPAEHKAALAQIIGSAGNPAAKAWLWPLLDDGNEQVVQAGIRALSALGGDDVSARITGLLTDNRHADAIRIEAALGLGTIGTPAARDRLLAAFGQPLSSELQTQILNSLGQFQFEHVAGTFEQYLAAPGTPSSMRVAAVEALAGSSAEAVPFLLRVAEGDTDGDVRASAAWAITGHDGVKDLGPVLADMAGREPAADVRRRLYEALLSQEEIPGERLLLRVQAESDIAARVAGFNAIGLEASHQPTSTLASVFDQEIVPELLQIATTPNTLNIQMRAVFALRRAQTPAAQDALAHIADHARPQIATAARNGLRVSKKS